MKSTDKEPETDLPSSVLATKLYPPPIRPNLVARPRLIDRMNMIDRARLTLVSAPAGYGKTTLICEWLDQEDLPVAWLSLDENDNNLKRLMIYLIAAIRTIQPGFGEMTLALMQTPQPPESNMILGTLINELDRSRDPLVLVLDDVHNVTDHQAHEALTFLLAHLPEPVHLVILTRSDPPVPLARLRAQDQLVEIRANDLRFTVEEATVLLNDTMGLGLSPDLVRSLEERTEGWITGLQLAALAIQDLDSKQTGEFIAEFTGSHHYIVDYLLEEVLNRQSDSVREFLLRTSVLERLTGDLCDALTGRSDGQAVLESLETGNLFIVPMDGQREWYRYHQLLADVLQSRLRQSHPELLTELHQKAARWFEAAGFSELALGHAVSGDDIRMAADIIEQNAMDLLMSGELVTLLNWIQLIEETASGDPWLSTYKSWALTLTGELDLAETWLRRSGSLMENSDPERAQELRGHMAAIRAYIAEARGEADRTIEHARKALALLPEGEQAVRSVVTFTLGTAYRLNGDHQRAIQALKTARLAGSISGNRYLVFGTLFTLADLTFDQGQLHESYAIYEETLQLAAQPGKLQLPAAGMAYFGLGFIQYEWNDLEAAYASVNEAIDLCRQWGHFVNLTASLVLLSRLNMAQGDFASARQSIQQAEEMIRAHDLALRAESWVRAFRVRLWLAQGNLEAARRWAMESGISVGDDFSYLREAEYHTLVRVYLVDREYDRALELCRRLREWSEATGRVGATIETLVLQARAFQVKGDHTPALDALARALSLAQPEGYLRVFLNEGTQMAELLRRAGTQGIEPQFVAKLLSEMNPSAAVSETIDQPLIEPLSDRQLEVLQLLADGLSNSDIAAKLIITVGTVKAHTASIYRKLNVNSRTQAVARARELKIL